MVSTYRGVKADSKSAKRTEDNKFFDEDEKLLHLNQTELITTSKNDIEKNKFNHFNLKKLITDKLYKNMDIKEVEKDDTPPKGLFGWATYCSQDVSTLRPTFLVIQFVSDLEVTIKDYEECIWTAIHELTHALGFDNSLFSDFIDENFNRKNLNETIYVRTKLNGLDSLLELLKVVNSDESLFKLDRSNLMINNESILPPNMQYYYSKDSNETLFIKEESENGDFDLVFKKESKEATKSERTQRALKKKTFNKIYLPTKKSFTDVKVDNNFSINELTSLS